MEKTFLKIARVALLCITSLALVVTLLTGLYGAFEFHPALPAQPPRFSIRLADMTAPKSAPSDASAEPSKKGNPISKSCQDVTGKLNKLNKEIGWQKQQDTSYNPATMQFEKKTSLDTGVEIDAGKLCDGTGRILDEQNDKLRPYIKNIALNDAYYGNLSSFLDEISKDSQRVQGISLADDSRYTVSSAFEWYNVQFDSAVNDARDKAAQKEVDRAEAKVKGASSLYAAAISFTFFFACCLILVFMRIESNMRDLVAGTKAQNPIVQ